MLAYFYAFMSSLGFGILFNVRGKDLFFASVGGGIGWLFYTQILSLTGSEVIALFIGTISLSIHSEICARIFKNPVTLYLICALIPLVPGSGMYYTIFEAVKGDYNTSLTKGIQTLLNAGSIAVAAMFVSTVSRVITALSAKNKRRRNLKKL